MIILCFKMVAKLWIWRNKHYSRNQRRANETFGSPVQILKKNFLIFLHSFLLILIKKLIGRNYKPILNFLLLYLIFWYWRNLSNIYF